MSAALTFSVERRNIDAPVAAERERAQLGPYFNEIDSVACAVLRECHPGVIDERSIKEVSPDDVRGYERAHFFAGAGLWEIAAGMAGWRRPLWTASCPCQPFSVAGKGAGRDDPRHLWPDFFRLARAVRPPVIVGEQVAGSAGFDWFDGVASDLEGEGYACRAVDIPACAVDAPHRRQRLYWVAVADASGARSLPTTQAGIRCETQSERPRHVESQRRYGGDDVADADRGGRHWRAQGAFGSEIGRNAAERADGELVAATGKRRGERRPEHEFRRGRDATAGADEFGVALGDAERPRLEGQRGYGDDLDERGWLGADAPRSTAPPNGSFWSDAEWLQCADGKARRAKPGLCLLAHGLAGRADLWRLAGNSIVPQVAAHVLAALAEALRTA
jgi:DNA (cytosine-5)-methyltransferase 1